MKVVENGYRRGEYKMASEKLTVSDADVDEKGCHSEHEHLRKDYRERRSQTTG